MLKRRNRRHFGRQRQVHQPGHARRCRLAPLAIGIVGFGAAHGGPARNIGKGHAPALNRCAHAALARLDRVVGADRAAICGIVDDRSHRRGAQLFQHRDIGDHCAKRDRIKMMPIKPPALVEAGYLCFAQQQIASGNMHLQRLGQQRPGIALYRSVIAQIDHHQRIAGCGIDRGAHMRGHAFGHALRIGQNAAPIGGFTAPLAQRQARALRIAPVAQAFDDGRIDPQHPRQRRGRRGAMFGQQPGQRDIVVQAGKRCGHPADLDRVGAVIRATGAMHRQRQIAVAQHEQPVDRAAARCQFGGLGAQPGVKPVKQRPQHGKTQRARGIGLARCAQRQRGAMRLRAGHARAAMAEQHARDRAFQPQQFGHVCAKLFQMHRVDAKRPYAQHIGMVVVADMQDLVGPRLDPGQDFAIQPFGLGLRPARRTEHPVDQPGNVIACRRCDQLQQLPLIQIGVGHDDHLHPAPPCFAHQRHRWRKGMAMPRLCRQFGRDRGGTCPRIGARHDRGIDRIDRHIARIAGCPRQCPRAAFTRGALHRGDAWQRGKQIRRRMTIAPQQGVKAIKAQHFEPGIAIEHMRQFMRQARCTVGDGKGRSRDRRGHRSKAPPLGIRARPVITNPLMHRPPA